MGKLLDVGIIQSSKPSGTPTYNYTIIGYTGGVINLYKNGSVVATPTADGGPTSISVVNGDTIRMLFTGTTLQGFSIEYKLNGVIQTTYTYSGTGIDTGTKTITANGAYLFTFNGAA